MKQVYIHFDQNKKKIERSLLAILILMFLHGVYKNALSYVIINKLDLITCLSLLLYPIITILWVMIFTKKIKLCLSDYIEALLLCIMIPPRFSLILFSLMTFLYYGVKKKLAKNLTNISLLLVFKVLTCLISYFIIKIDYQNIIEASTPYLYSSFDLLFGRAVGNLGATSILLLILYFGVSAQNIYYKKELSVTILETYIILAILYSCFYTHEDFLPIILNSHVFYASIILTSNPSTSPAEKKYLYAFGILTSFLAFILTLIFHHVNGIYYSLLFTQTIWTVLHKYLKLI